MRSIFVHFQTATEAEVIAFMDQHFHRNRLDSDNSLAPLWVVFVNDDPCLYIDFYRDMNDEWEVEQWFDLQERLDSEPSCSLIADISFRHRASFAFSDDASSAVPRSCRRPLLL